MMPSILRAAGVALLLSSTAIVPMLTPTQVVAQSFRFSNVEITGNRRIEAATILSFMGIARGEGLSAGQVNEAVQNIRASGLFSQVEATPRGRTLVLTVVEYPTINVVAWEGNRRLDDAELDLVTTSTSRRVFTPAQAEADAAAITEAYANQGRLAATVEPRIIQRSDNRVDLVFEITEGGVVEIERLSFTGNKAYSDRRLRRTLETKQAGLFRALVRRDVFVEDRIQFDRQVLRDFYRSRGYVDMRVQSVNAELDRNRGGFFLTFNVIEGQRFDFGEISVSSELSDVDAIEFERFLRLRSGRTYSPVAIDDQITRLEIAAEKAGLNFVRVEPRITRNDRDLTLDVEFVLQRGPRIFVERIDIEGNTTTLDRVIRRQFTTVEGDPFNPRQLRQSAERIRALGFFGQSDVNAREGSSPQQVVVDVDVTEKNTGELSFGGNFSSANGVSLVASFNERNFLGRGQKLAVNLSTAAENRRLSFSFAEPSILNRDVGFALNLSYSQTDYDDTRYNTRAFNFTPSLSFPISENGRLSTRFFYEDERLELVTPATGLDLIDAEASQPSRDSMGLGYTYTFDNRRSGVDPDTGFVFRFSQDFGGLAGDQKYVRTTALLGAETKVLSEDVTLRATLEGGHVAFKNNDSRVTDRFFLNSNIFRGFERNGIGPREISGTENDALGGTTYAVARLEAQFPIGLPEEYGITGGVFYDIGSLWGLDQTNANVVGEEMSLRSVVGFSIFWDTAIGPLRFNFTDTLEKEAFDTDTSFDLTISTSF